MPPLYSSGFINGVANSNEWKFFFKKKKISGSNGDKHYALVILLDSDKHY